MASLQGSRPIWTIDGGVEVCADSGLDASPSPSAIAPQSGGKSLGDTRHRYCLDLDRSSISSFRRLQQYPFDHGKDHNFDRDHPFTHLRVPLRLMRGVRLDAQLRTIGHRFD
jgi:hypothetical protein